MERWFCSRLSSYAQKEDASAMEATLSEMAQRELRVEVCGYQRDIEFDIKASRLEAALARFNGQHAQSSTAKTLKLRVMGAAYWRP